MNKNEKMKAIEDFKTIHTCYYRELMDNFEEVNDFIIDKIQNDKIDTFKDTTSIELLLTVYPNSSLRKLAQDAKISYNGLIRESKAPIPFAMYNPDAVNYGALQNYLDENLVNLNKLDWEEMNQGRTRTCTTEKDLDFFKVGGNVWLRNIEIPYKIVFKTLTHVVLMQFDSSTPLAWSITTFLSKSPTNKPIINADEYRKFINLSSEGLEELAVDSETTVTEVYNKYYEEHGKPENSDK